jgi:hypothetical protein
MGESQTAQSGKEARGWLGGNSGSPLPVLRTEHLFTVLARPRVQQLVAAFWEYLRDQVLQMGGGTGE